MGMVLVVLGVVVVVATLAATVERVAVILTRAVLEWGAWWLVLAGVLTIVVVQERLATGMRPSSAQVSFWICFLTTPA
jgi:hypothetical protein